MTNLKERLGKVNSIENESDFIVLDLNVKLELVQFGRANSKCNNGSCTGVTNNTCSEGTNSKCYNNDCYSNWNSQVNHDCTNNRC